MTGSPTIYSISPALPAGLAARPAPVRAQTERHPVVAPRGHAPAGPTTRLTEDQRVLLGDLFAVVEEHAEEAAEKVDRDLVEQSFVFACERHADQRRASGEDFIVHPIGVAKICAGMRLDTGTLCAALLHDTVEDTSASLDEVRVGLAHDVDHDRRGLIHERLATTEQPAVPGPVGLRSIPMVATDAAAPATIRTGPSVWRTA